jgi:hypothetical protein
MQYPTPAILLRGSLSEPKTAREAIHWFFGKIGIQERDFIRIETAQIEKRRKYI